MERVNNLFANTTTGLTATLQKFANALQDVANNPTSIVCAPGAAERGERRRGAPEVLRFAARELDEQVEGATSAAKPRTSRRSPRSIAQLNDADLRRRSGRDRPAAQRPARPARPLLDQLSAHIDVTTVKQDDGRINVFVGSGQPLVVGGTAAGIVTTADPLRCDPPRHRPAGRRVERRRHHRQHLTAARSAARSTSATRCSTPRATRWAASASGWPTSSTSSIARASI